jgi:Wzt C-terminal domain
LQRVAVYLSLFKGAAVNIAGSGEVSVARIRLEGPNGQSGMGETLDLSHGDSLRLRASVDCTPGLGEARLQFLFWNSEMLPVMDIMTDELTGYLFPIPPSGAVELTAFIPRIELGTGIYALSVIAISADKSRVFCRHDNAAYVQVTAPTASGAQVLPVAEWNVIPPQSTAISA